MDEIDTGWVDSFMNDDLEGASALSDQSTQSSYKAGDEFGANDRSDRERSDYTPASTETSFDPFDTNYFTDNYTGPSDQDYLNALNQKAQEDAAAGLQYAYTPNEISGIGKRLRDTEGELQDTNIFNTVGRTLAGTNKKLEKSFEESKDVLAKAMEMFAKDRDPELIKLLEGYITPTKDTERSDAAHSGIANLKTQVREALPKLKDVAANGFTKQPGLTVAQEQEYATRDLNAMNRRLQNAMERGDYEDILKVSKLIDEEAQRLEKEYKGTGTMEGLSKAIAGAKQAADVADVYKPDTPAPTPTPARATPRVTPTSDAVTNEFTEMFNNPNVDSYEDYNSPVETPAEPATAPDTSIPALTRDEADYERMRAQGWDADRMVRDPNTGKWLRDEPEDRDKSDINNSDSVPNTSEDSSVTPHGDELSTLLPVEVINTNPENVSLIAEQLDNNDVSGASDTLAQTLSPANFLSIIEQITLGAAPASEGLTAALANIWYLLMQGQSVGNIKASDLSNVSPERRDAINKAFAKYSESDLKDLGYYSRDTSATKESDYNKGLKEDTNEVVSDSVKKYVISNPWILKAVSKWSK